MCVTKYLPLYRIQSITIVMQVVDTCKKYSIDRNSKEVSKAAWALHLAPEEWSFLRRVNW